MTREAWTKPRLEERKEENDRRRKESSVFACADPSYAWPAFLQPQLRSIAGYSTLSRATFSFPFSWFYFLAFFSLATLSGASYGMALHSLFCLTAPSGQAVIWVDDHEPRSHSGRATPAGNGTAL